MIWRTGEFSQFLYRGGFVVLSLATVMVLMPLAHPACRLGNVVGCKPLRWIGVRSYGIYLWQTPVIVLTSPQHPHGHSLLRDVLQLAAIFAIAALSWKFVEEPIRHGAIGRLLARRRRVGWSWATFSPEGRIVLVSLGVLLIVAVAGMAGLNAAQAEGEQIRVKEATAAGTKGPVPLTKAQAADSQKTSCKRVVHIGDSTSEGLDSAEYLPSPNERIENRYAEVGVKETHMEVQGARSIEERFEGEPNAQEVAEAWKAEGYKGCWVLALGTNEAADVAAGLERRPGRTRRKNDEHHRRRTGPLGQRQDAPGGDRILRREGHEEMGRNPRSRLPSLSQHAHLQLGRRRQRRLVHRRRHPLHLARLRGSRRPDRPGPRARLPRKRHLAERRQMRRQLSIG